MIYSLRSEVLRLVRKKIRENRREFLALEKAEKSIAQSTFIVSIFSSWADYGEKSVETRGRDLEATLAKAASLFKRINQRSDVQGKFSVAAAFPGKCRIPLPETFYAHLIPK